MEDKKSEIGDQTPESADSGKPAPKKKSNFKWILLIVFVAMMAKIILAPKAPEVQWLDYESGVKLAKQQGKPILIAFYKAGYRFCTDMWADTYANEPSIKFIEDNFIPILIDGDKQPGLAKEYDVTYYPTHFIKTSDNKEIIKTKRGYDTPGQFKPFLLESLEKMNRKPKN